MGSGSLNAMAVFEAGYKDDMTREEAMELAARAIRRLGGGGEGVGVECFGRGRGYALKGRGDVEECGCVCL